MVDEHFSWEKLLIGIAKMLTNKFFLAFIVITLIVKECVMDHQSDEVKVVILIIWGAVTGVWLLIDPLSKLLEKGNLNIDVKTGATINKNITETKG